MTRLDFATPNNADVSVAVQGSSRLVVSKVGGPTDSIVVDLDETSRLALIAHLLTVDEFTQLAERFVPLTLKLTNAIGDRR